MDSGCIRDPIGCEVGGEKAGFSLQNASPDKYLNSECRDLYARKISEILWFVTVPGNVIHEKTISQTAAHSTQKFYKSSSRY